ncbi:hypothetical protein TNCV_597211, partial [Trichonephila clavipes]
MVYLALDTVSMCVTRQPAIRSKIVAGSSIRAGATLKDFRRHSENDLRSNQIKRSPVCASIGSQEESAGF